MVSQECFNIICDMRSTFLEAQFLSNKIDDTDSLKGRLGLSVISLLFVERFRRSYFATYYKEAISSHDFMAHSRIFSG